MPRDPFDPNQDSQQLDEVIDPTTGAITNQATAQMNDFGAYMRSHPGWTPTPAQLQEINAQLKDGRISPNDPSYLPLYLMAAAVGATIGGGAAFAGGGGAAAPSAAATAPSVGTAASAAATGGSTSALSTVLNSKAPEALADIFSKAGASDVAQGNISDQIKLALQNARVNNKRVALSAPGERLATGERAALAKAAKPASVQWGGPGSGLRGEVPTYTGGIKSIYDANQIPDMKALHDRVLQDSLASQLAGGPTGGNLDQDLGSAANVGEGSTAGDVLGGVGMGTSILAALKKAGIFGKGPGPSETIPDGV